MRDTGERRSRKFGSWPSSVRSTTVAAVACLVAFVLAMSVSAGSLPREAELAPVVDAAAEGRLAGASLFVHASGERWFPPLAVYPSSLLLRAGVPRGMAYRLPAAVAIVLTIVFVYLIAVRCLEQPEVGAWAALLLVAVPAWVPRASLAGGDLLLLPAVLAWALAVAEHVQRPRWWVPIAGGAALGVAVYTQPAGALTTGIALLLGGAVLWRRPGGALAVGSAALAVAVMWLPALVWILRAPEAYADTFGRWLIHPAHVRRPWDGIVASTRWHVLARRVGTYWEYLHPVFLFGSAQVFGLAMAALLPLGVWRAARPAAGVPRRLLLAALLAAPLAGVLLDVEPSGALALVMVPFGALLAGDALDALVRADGARRAAGVVLLALTALGPFTQGR